MTKLNNVVMRVINGVVISVTILVTLFMRSSGSVHSVLEFQNVAGEIHRFSYQNELFPNDFLMPYSLSTFVHNDFRRTF